MLRGHDKEGDGDEVNAQRTWSTGTSVKREKHAHTSPMEYRVVWVEILLDENAMHILNFPAHGNRTAT